MLTVAERLPLILLNRALVNAAGEVQNLAANGGLSRVHMPNEHHIHVVPARMSTDPAMHVCGTNKIWQCILTTVESSPNISASSVDSFLRICVPEWAL